MKNIKERDNEREYEKARNKIKKSVVFLINTNNRKK
jgi:hypothetical protein